MLYLAVSLPVSSAEPELSAVSAHRQEQGPMCLHDFSLNPLHFYFPPWEAFSLACGGLGFSYP